MRTLGTDRNSSAHYVRNITARILEGNDCNFLYPLIYLNNISEHVTEHTNKSSDPNKYTGSGGPQLYGSACIVKERKRNMILSTNAIKDRGIFNNGA